MSRVNLGCVLSFIPAHRNSYFFSIGKQLQAVKGGKPDDNELDNQLYSDREGSDIAYKHQQAVEMIPFILQAGDDPLVYCRIAHFLRTTPAWRVWHPPSATI